MQSAKPESMARASQLRWQPFADKWMKEYAEKNLKKATISMYRGTIKRYIKDSIGVNQLGKVKVLQVQQWLNYLQEEKQISQKTIRNSFFLLNNIFQYAMKWSYVKSNPCELATLQARNRKEAGYYTNDEVITLLDKLATLPKEKLYLRIGIMLTLFTGMRKGELMGLTWEDVYFDTCTLSINKTRQLHPRFRLLYRYPEDQEQCKKPYPFLQSARTS